MVRCSKRRSPMSIRKGLVRQRATTAVIRLNRYPDGLEKCIGCELCAWASPGRRTHVEGADNTKRSGCRANATPGVPGLTACVASVAVCIEACPRGADDDL